MRLARQGRTAIVVAVVSVAALATPSMSSTPRSCMLIQDATGDATDQPNLSVPGINQPDLDIVSGDVASDARSVTTVIRVQRLGTALDAPGRRNMYQFSFYLGGFGDVVTQAYRGIDGESFYFNIPNERIDNGPDAGSDLSRSNLPATGVFDVARSEVRVTLPLLNASGPRHAGPKTQFTRLAADTFRGFGTSTPLPTGLATGMDHAVTMRTYRAGSPSCVQVGH